MFVRMNKASSKGLFIGKVVLKHGFVPLYGFFVTRTLSCFPCYNGFLLTKYRGYLQSPQSALMAAVTAIAAVSVRNIRGPKQTGYQFDSVKA